MDLLNIIGALLSIGLGLLGWLVPKYVMGAIDLEATSPMGPSEIRASAGALFVGLGLGALILGGPAAYAMVGFAWGFAGIGRLTSLVFDGYTPRKMVFFATEAVVGLVLIFGNLPLGAA